MTLLRTSLGDTLRRQRQRQARTLREVSSAARVSLGYLSEVERGQKEASSELLASICAALGVQLSQVLREASDELALTESGAGGSAARRTPLTPVGGDDPAVVLGAREGTPPGAVHSSVVAAA